MKRLALAGLLATTLAAPAYSAGVPSAAEVSSARATCHSHKLDVRAAEARLGPDHAALPEKRLAWERSCQHAQLLIDARENGHAPRTLARSSTSVTTRRSAEFAAAEQRQPAQLAPCDSADLSVY